jgi:hypothetical protein
MRIYPRASSPTVLIGSAGRLSDRAFGNERTLNSRTAPRIKLRTIKPTGSNEDRGIEDRGEIA